MLESAPREVSLTSKNLRTWSDTKGQFKIDAELVSYKGTQVRLRKSDGTELTVDTAKLSEPDLAYLQGL